MTGRSRNQLFHAMIIFAAALMILTVAGAQARDRAPGVNRSANNEAAGNETAKNEHAKNEAADSAAVDKHYLALGAHAGHLIGNGTAGSDFFFGLFGQLRAGRDANLQVEWAAIGDGMFSQNTNLSVGDLEISSSLWSLSANVALFKGGKTSTYVTAGFGVFVVTAENDGTLFFPTTFSDNISMYHFGLGLDVSAGDNSMFYLQVKQMFLGGIEENKAFTYSGNESVLSMSIGLAWLP